MKWLTWLYMQTDVHIFESLQLEGLYRRLTVINLENNLGISCIIWSWIEVTLCFSGGASGKELTCQCRRDVRDVGSTPGLGRPPGGGQATHSSILAWRIPWSEEPGGLQSMESQREGQNPKQLRTQRGDIISQRLKDRPSVQSRSMSPSRTGFHGSFKIIIINWFCCKFISCK